MVVNWNPTGTPARTELNFYDPFDPRFTGQPAQPQVTNSVPLQQAYQTPGPSIAPDAFTTWVSGNAPVRQPMRAEPPATGAQQRPAPTMGTPAQDTASAPGGNWASWDAPETGDLGGAQWNGTRWVVNRAVNAGEAIGRTGAKIAVNYNGYQDLDRHEFNGQASEPSWRRVNRWAADNMRLYGMDAQSAHNAALARLKRDYERAGADWRRSGFDLSNVQAMTTEQPVPGTNYVPASGGGVPGQPPQPTSTPALGQQPTPGTPAPPPGYRGNNPGNSAGGMNAAARMALAGDPNLAYDLMMQQLGIDPNAPGLFTKFLRQRFSPLLQARLAASGLEGASAQKDDKGDTVLGGGNYMDTIDSVIRDFGEQAGARGGNFFGDMASIGNTAARDASGVLGQLTDQEQAIQYLQQLGSLRFAGLNPLLQQASADVMERGQRTYARDSLNALNERRNMDPFTQWLLSQSQYRDIYGI